MVTSAHNSQIALSEIALITIYVVNNSSNSALAEKLNAPGACGSCLLPVPGEVFTELDALAALTGACVELVATGGVCGAEGCVWLAVSGTKEQEEYAKQILASVADEPAFGQENL